MKKSLTFILMIGLLGTAGCIECKVRDQGASSWIKVALDEPADFADGLQQCREQAKQRSFWQGYNWVDWNIVQKDADTGAVIEQASGQDKLGHTACRVFTSRTAFETGAAPQSPPANGVLRIDNKSFTIVDAHNQCRNHAQDRANDHGVSYFWTGNIEQANNGVTTFQTHHGEGVVNPAIPPPPSPVIGDIDCGGSNLTGPLPPWFVNFYPNVTESNKCAFAQECVTQSNIGAMWAYLDLHSTSYDDNIQLGRQNFEFPWEAEGLNDCQYAF